MTPNSNFTALLTTTLNNHSATLTDNITADVSLLDALQKAGRVKPFDGGPKIIEPLMYALSNGQSWSGYDVLDAVPFDGITAAEFEMKNHAVPITISDDELDKNRGKSAVMSLLETRTEIAKKSMVEDMEAMFFADGLGSGGKDMLGLQALVEIDTSVGSTVAPALGGSGTVGGITRSSTYAFWQNYNNLGTQTTSAFDNLIKAWTNMYYALCRGKDQPHAIFTTKVVLAGYESLLLAKQEWVGNDKADAKYKVLTFAGMPILTSYYCPSGTSYMLNFDYLKFRPHVSWNFKNTEFKRPDRQMAEVAFIIVKGNLTITNCNRQGVTRVIT